MVKVKKKDNSIAEIVKKELGINHPPLKDDYFKLLTRDGHLGKFETTKLRYKYSFKILEDIIKDNYGSKYSNEYFVARLPYYNEKTPALFVCTSELTVDSFIYLPKQRIIKKCSNNDELEKCKNDNGFSIVGELSDAAVWVKEKMRLIKDNIHVIPHPMTEFKIPAQSIPQRFIVLIKCPTCNTFH